MLWQHYVLRRGNDINKMWDRLYEDRNVNLLYITGRGFDIRGNIVLEQLVQNIKTENHNISNAEMLLIDYSGYELDEKLITQTQKNTDALRELFSDIGLVKDISISTSVEGEDDISTSNSLRIGISAILESLDGYTDIILDVSAFPRVVYLSLMTGILEKLIPDKTADDALFSSGVNFQILVAEDAELDSLIQSEEPSNDLVLVPGFAGVLQIESANDWPMVWFPILGENRISQLQIILKALIPNSAEICPVLPHPASNPHRADELIMEYELPLFAERQIPISNILYAHERNPFEAYRQLLKAMQDYRESLCIIEGCRIVMTPFASKLITIGAGLACFDMKTSNFKERYGVAIPYVEPTRYSATMGQIINTKPSISSLLLTGNAYGN